jgi:hypothetical protein
LQEEKRFGFDSTTGPTKAIAESSRLCSLTKVRLNVKKDLQKTLKSLKVNFENVIGVCNAADETTEMYRFWDGVGCEKTNFYRLWGSMCLIIAYSASTIAAGLSFEYGLRLVGK